MSLELKDFRGRLTPETDAVLEGQAFATGRDKHEILRDVMHEWAQRNINAYTVTDKRLRAEGLPGIGGGTGGNLREVAGSCGKACARAAVSTSQEPR